jgi:hypothetical protein
MTRECLRCGATYLLTKYTDAFCSPGCRSLAVQERRQAGHCKDCRHWTDPRQQAWWDSFAKWGQCAKTNIDQNDSPLMIAEVNPVRFIPVTTREDFGCVMFEAKDNDA